MPITREQALDEARHAADKSKTFAQYAEIASSNGDSTGKVPRITAVGGLWADVARSYAAIAAALPATADTPEA